MTKTKISISTVLAVLLIVAVGCPSDDSALQSGAGTAVDKQDESICNVMVRKYHDLNANGFLDPEDPEIGQMEYMSEGWPVYWTDPSGAEFSGVAPVWCVDPEAAGTYTFWEGAVDGWFPTGAIVNWEMVEDFAAPIPVDIVPGETYEIIFLNANEEVPPPLCNLTILKFNDLNNNGVVDGGEPEIEWPVTIIDPNDVEYNEVTPVCFNADVLGVWTIVDGIVDGWWQTAAFVNGVLVQDPVTVEFTSDETFEVVFLNATCQGGEPGHICAFKGYDVDADGPGNDTPIEGFQVCLEGLTLAGDPVGPICQFTGPDGFACWTDLLPGTYTVSEVVPEGDWIASTPASFEVVLTEGGYQEVVFSNYCAETITMHTKGWWQNKNGCAAVAADPALLDALNALAPFMSGTIYTRGTDNCTGERCANVVLPFDSNSELGCYMVAPNSQNARLGLAQQLAAFVLNVINETGNLELYFPGLDMTAQEIVDAAVQAWITGVDASYWQEALDMLNNAEEIYLVSPVPCPIEYDNNIPD